MVLHALPRRNDKRAQQQPRVPRGADIGELDKARVGKAFDRESFQEVKNVVGERVQQHEARYALTLANLSPKPPGFIKSQLPPEAPTLAPRLSLGPLADFPQMEVNIPEPVSELRSLLSQRQYEVLIRKATRKGAIRKGQTTGKERKGYGRRQWESELKNLPNAEYHYSIPLGVTYERRVHICMCPVTFAAKMDVGDSKVSVKIELSPSGHRHCDLYATSATDDDPAARLAIRVRVKDSAGLETIYYEL
ncbi:hypothetical protein BDW59DRAFT_156964 [Aspergillus cavernicola]|uniref:Uncharacterized protein n=1 Tax=Aspergillus cavernicola TaxID=176166 RepID=A0ABR4IYF5_9EURO